MPYFPEYSFQKSVSKCSKKILCRFQLREVGSQASVRSSPVKRPDAHQSATSVRTTWQYCPDAHQCLEDSNRSRLHPSRCSSEFDKKSNFLHRHRYGKIATSIQMTGKHRSDAILDKAIRGEELQPSWTSGQHHLDAVLIMVITCSRSAIIQTLGQ